MKIMTFIGSDSTQAMRKVKASLGNDVALLSCRRTDEGVELVVGVEQGVARPTAHRATPAASPEQRENQARARLQQALAENRSNLEQVARGSEWNVQRAKNPSRRPAIDLLKALDIEPRIANALIKRLPQEEPLKVQQDILHGLLRRAIKTLPTPAEGVTALVGPPGAGKTTTIAKIAANFVQRGETDDIALITTDTQRIAAEEQLRVYGNIFRVPVHAAANADEAAKLIHMLSHKKYLLLDTEGVGLRDHDALHSLGEMFSALPDMDVFLVLPADRDYSSLAEITRRFRELPVNGVIPTHLDECVRLGGLLSVLIQNRLPMVWSCDGGMVPGNIQPGDSTRLVGDAFRLAREFNRSRSRNDAPAVYRRKGVAA